MGNSKINNIYLLWNRLSVPQDSLVSTPPTNEVGVRLCGEFRNDTDTSDCPVGTRQLVRIYSNDSNSHSQSTVLLFLVRVGLPRCRLVPSPFHCLFIFMQDPSSKEHLKRTLSILSPGVSYNNPTSILVMC